MLESRAPCEPAARAQLLEGAPKRPGSASLLDAGVVKIVTSDSGSPAGGRLTGKTALITGGGTGIGRAIALAFAREGAPVAIAGRRLEKLQQVAEEIVKHGGQAIALECDVTRAKDAERAVQDAARKFGRLNVLVNNAGTLSVSTVANIS